MTVNSCHYSSSQPGFHIAVPVVVCPSHATSTAPAVSVWKRVSSSVSTSSAEGLKSALSDPGSGRRVEYIWALKGTYSQAWWQGPTILASQECEGEGLQSQRQPGQFSESLSCLKMRTRKSSEYVQGWDTWKGCVLKPSSQKRGAEMLRRRRRRERKRKELERMLSCHSATFLVQNHSLHIQVLWNMEQSNYTHMRQFAPCKS